VAMGAIGIADGLVGGRFCSGAVSSVVMGSWWPVGSGACSCGSVCVYIARSRLSRAECFGGDRNRAEGDGAVGGRWCDVLLEVLSEW
jgi:hypothetical protein